MKKIAILVSGEGRATERIVKLFNEGNRVHTDLVVTDETSVSLEERLKGQDTELLFVPQQEWLQKTNLVAGLLKEKGIDLLVLDNFEEVLTDEILEATGGEMLRVSSPEMAPREVVNVLEADLRKPAPEVINDDKDETIEPAEPTLESEWADALKIPFTPPKIPEIKKSEEINNEKEAAPNIISQDNNTPPFSGGNFGNPTERPRNYYYQERDNAPRREESRDEPMPSTWLIWSILVTIFCCFIPGIIAIIFSSQVSSRYYAGDIEGARRSSRMAEIWIIVSFVLGVLTATLYFPFMLIG